MGISGHKLLMRTCGRNACFSNWNEGGLIKSPFRLTAQLLCTQFLNDEHNCIVTLCIILV